MTPTADRYNQLAESYVKLSEKFQQLDVEHMGLKQKLIPLLKALQSYQRVSAQWKHKKAELEDRLQSLESENSALKAALEQAKTQESELLESLKSVAGQHESLTEMLENLKVQKEDLEISALNLNAEKSELLGKLQALEAQWTALKPLEALLQPQSQAILDEAEAQISLVEETLQEMADDSDPDLSETDKQLLAEYYDHPEKFALMAIEPGEVAVDATLAQDVSVPVPMDFPQSA